MKILCISDHIDPQIYTSSIKERFHDIDMVLSAGDLPLNYLDFIVSNLNKPLFFVFGNHHIDEIRHYKKMWDTPFSQEDRNYMGCGAVHIGSKVKLERLSLEQNTSEQSSAEQSFKKNNIILAGLGGSIRYNKGNNQFTEFEMFLEVIKLMPRLLWNRVAHGRFVDILLTHAPPKGIHDNNDKCHWGFKTFLWFMKTFKPKFLVHGHIHLYDLCAKRRTEWENTIVINAYNHYVIDTSGGCDGC